MCALRRAIVRLSAAPPLRLGGMGASAVRSGRRRWPLLPISVWAMGCLWCRPGLLRGFTAPSAAGVGAAGWQDGDVGRRVRESRRIVVMVGAGMSVAAGIPDFRTPGTGLYDNLEKYNLPYPEAVFDLDFLRKDPAPFYMLCKELWPGQYRPTLAHYFIALLHQKGLLLRCYSQNIDSLETLAGLPKEALIAAHGNFDSATCMDTQEKVPPEEVREAVMVGAEACYALNRRYGGLVKPDIVFFGESLPDRFNELSLRDLQSCDLLVILGTSLKVYPFAGLVNLVKPGTPRLLLNREEVGEELGLMFGEPKSADVFVPGDCDAGVLELARLLGCEVELVDLHAKESRRLAEGDGATIAAGGA
mmetsp:Transcript_81908/g.222333  ORF Transcript_81908/g.222333 Transcript_81908/m.222333 type:complete len:361 (-) Transcript_81908:23-1105(-)